MDKSILKLAALTTLVGLSLTCFGQSTTKDSTTKATSTTAATTTAASTTLSENADSTKLDSLEAKVSNLQKTLYEIKKIVTNDTVTTFSIGTFKLFATDEIKVYKYVPTNMKKEDCDKKSNSEYSKGKCTTKEEASFKITISKVIIEISDGVITDIQVITKENKTFSNGLAPIAVNKFNERCDWLSYKNELSEYYYLPTCNFLNWERNGGYSPSDVRFELIKKDETRSLAKDVGINSVFNIKLYTDMLSAFGGEDNGLIQTEANFKTPLISSNLYNKPVFLLHYFTTNFRLSRFDDKFKYTSVLVDNSDTIHSSSDTSFSRQTLHQRNWLNFDVGFNLISGQFGNKSKSGAALDLVVGFALSNFASSTDTLTVGLPYIGLNPSIKIIPAPNFGIILSSQLIWQYAPQLKDKSYGQEKKIISPELEMFWNPLSSPGNKIFARARYVTMFGDNNPFWQFQLGYNLSLSEIINKKLENK